MDKRSSIAEMKRYTGKTSRFALAKSIAIGSASLIAATALGISGEKDLPDSLPDFALVESSVVIPIPSEIFNVLEKFDYKSADWKAQLQLPGDKLSKDLVQTALYLGSVVAEGFLAVQAEDSESVSVIGRKVLELSEALGLRDAVLQHCNGIQKAADSEDWEQVREEFDATRQTVRDIMAKRRDDDLAHCVSIGGWVRGTEIVTSMILKKFSPDQAELLYQPGIMEQFEKSISQMSPQVQKGKGMKGIAKRIQELKETMEKGANRMELKTVKTIRFICTQLSTDLIP